MVLQNCRGCNELFVSTTVDVCNRCLEDAYLQVQKYLEGNRRANILELVRDTGLSLMTVNSILKDGRLSL